ncbi:MAG TPA: TetR/AcrR family transcriptional regulator, partial [Balneolales bacterium]|nr:TetR/AcrR family transcriptional regulator [Balneolales bacterium]
EKKRKLLETITREGIYKAVEKIIAEDGIEGLTMNRLAEQAGIAKGTIYLYFKDKKELIQSAMDYSLSPLKDGVIQILDSNKEPEVILKEYTLFIVAFFKKNLSRFRVMQYRLNQQDGVKPHFNTKGKEHFQLSVQKVAEVIDRGITEHKFRKINSQTFAHMYIKSNIAIVTRYLCIDEGKASDIDADAELLIDVFLNGIKNH